jgi:serine/threonine protein kinase
MLPVPAVRPTRMGRYEIRKELGRGMMGVVYEAHDPLLHRSIALKTIHFAHVIGGSEGEHYEKRFLTEARTAARLSHPGIVVVHDVGRDEETGILFIALELVSGQTLADRLSTEGFSDWKEALRIAGRVADALDHAHAHGVIHRDIKPANIMISSSAVPKIMDFGIARIETSELTSPGEIFGTPLYMAPEQALGEAVDARSDIFSLGSVLYAMLTDRSPFFAPTVPAILAQVAYKDPTPPSELVRGLPEDLDYVVARALAKDPSSRYTRARSMAEDLDDIRSGHPPRHRLGYVLPERAERTLVSIPFAAKPRIDTLVDESSEPRSRTHERERRPVRRRPPLRLLATLGAVALAYALVHPEVVQFWKSRYDGLREAMAPVSTVSPGAVAPVAEGPVPAAEATPSVTGGPSPEPQSSANGTPVEESHMEPSSVGGPATSPESLGAGSPAPVAESPSPAPTPALTPDPTPAPAASSEAESPAGTDEGSDLEDIEAAPDPQGEALPPEAVRALSPPPDEKPAPSTASPKAAPQQLPRPRLRVEFEHTIKDGWLRIWIDKKRVLTERLKSSTGKVSLRFRTSKHQVRDSLRLAPGRHGVYVEVTSNAKSKKAASSLVLQLGPGDNRALVILLDKDELRLSLY